ncbi:MAG: hypothetical protein KGL39_20500 [Patescibacteria group bacterium]|nr:hypothetical protein [Patescibacteria group bacterium]
MTPPLVVEVFDCPRCREFHGRVEFKPLTRGSDCSHWAMCPVTHEPMLLENAPPEPNAPCGRIIRRSH